MATFTLESPAISVSLPEGVSKEQILSFPPFNNWLSTLTASLALQRRDPRHPFHADPYALRSVAVRSADLWAGGRAGFVMLRADVRNAAGESLPGAVFLRGPSVGMLVMLVPDDDVQVTPPSPSSSLSGPHPHLDPYAEERYAVLTVQPRVPAGSLAFAELPAGMVDDDDDDDDNGRGGGGGGSRGGKFAGAAAREIQEELGIEIPASELVCLSDLAGAADGGEGEGEGEEGEGGKGGEEEEEGLANAMYPSAGGCDEYVPLYMHERRVPRAALREWRGRLTGLRAHGERITLRLVPMRDLWREGRRDAKALAALALWERLKREGKI